MYFIPLNATDMQVLWHKKKLYMMLYMEQMTIMDMTTVVMMEVIMVMMNMEMPMQKKTCGMMKVMMNT